MGIYSINRPAPSVGKTPTQTMVVTPGPANGTLGLKGDAGGNAGGRGLGPWGAFPYIEAPGWCIPVTRVNPRSSFSGSSASNNSRADLIWAGETDSRFLLTMIP